MLAVDVVGTTVGVGLLVFGGRRWELSGCLLPFERFSAQGVQAWLGKVKLHLPPDLHANKQCLRNMYWLFTKAQFVVFGRQGSDQRYYEVSRNGEA